MSDLKLTAEKTMTFMDSKDGKGVFKTPKRLESFGEAQNEYNKLVMENINDMKKRICHLEDEQELSIERFKRCASELQSFKAELDILFNMGSCSYNFRRPYTCRYCTFCR